VDLADDAVRPRLQRALAEGRLELAYQPKFSFAAGRVCGVEALMRWDEPGIGPVSPSHFIPLAERAGLIDALTDWGLRYAVGQWLDWREQGLALELAFNISAATLRNMEFPDAVQRLCHEAGMPSEMLTLELTEGATQDAVRLMDTLSRFRIKGMKVALDDFGTGYSSLLQLRQLPFSELKIDRWFVEDSVRSDDAALLIRSIIDLSHGLGLSVTAEGIATQAQFDLLQDFGCDQGQGEFIAAPLPGPALAPWLLARGDALHAAWARQRAPRTLPVHPARPI